MVAVAALVPWFGAVVIGAVLQRPEWVGRQRRPRP